MLDPTQYPNGHTEKATDPYTTGKTEKVQSLYPLDEIRGEAGGYENPCYTNPYLKNPYLPEGSIMPPPPPLSTRLCSYVRVHWLAMLMGCVIVLFVLFTSLLAGYAGFPALNAGQVQVGPGSENHSAQIAKKLIIAQIPAIKPTPTSVPPTLAPTPVSPTLAPTLTMSNIDVAAQVASRMQQIDPDIVANVQNLDISTPPAAYPNRPDMGTSYSCFGADHCTEFIIEVFSTISAMNEDILWHKQNACDSNASNCYYYSTSISQQACLLIVPQQQSDATVTLQDFMALEPIFEQACS